MVNIGEITKPSVDPQFDRSSRAKKSASQAGAVESAAAIKPVREQETDQAADQLTISSQKKKQRKDNKRESSSPPETAQGTDKKQDVSAETDAGRAAQQHIDIRV